MNTLIIDDVKKTCDELKEMLSQITDDTIACCDSEGSVSNLIREERFKPDIVFMDIRLTDCNGITLAKEIFSANPQVQIIFISGYDDYYLDVYDVEHVYFLRKPIGLELLQKAYAKAVEKLDAIEKDVFVFGTGLHKTLIHYRDILYFEKLKRKVLIYTLTENTPYSYYATMTELSEKLPAFFVRCHNSYIVNLDAVTTYRPGQIKIDDQQIPVSRKYKDTFSNAFYQRLENRLT